MSIANAHNWLGETAGLQSLDFTDQADDLLRHAARQYRLEFGWPTFVTGGQLMLVLDEDILGLRMPTTLAVGLVAALRAMGLSCPVVNLPDPDGPHSIVLLEPAGREPAPPLPATVGALPCGHRMALPPSMTARGPVHWLAGREPHNTAAPPVPVVAAELARLACGPVSH